MLNWIQKALEPRRNARVRVPFAVEEIVQEIEALRRCPLSPEETETVYALFDRNGVSGVRRVGIAGGVFEFGIARPMVSREIRRL